MRQNVTYSIKKRTWILLLSYVLLFSYSQSVNAQAVPTPVANPASVVKKAKPWQIGVEAGLDLSRFSASKELFSPDNQTGWFAGLKIKTKIPLPNLGVDGAVLYSQNDIDYMIGTDYRQKRMHTIVVPANLRYNWKIDSNFILYIASGPQWNWLLDKSHISNIGKLNHSYFDWNIGMGLDLFKHVQFGFNYNILLGKMGEVNNVNLEGHTWNIRFAYFF